MQINSVSLEKKEISEQSERKPFEKKLESEMKSLLNQLQAQSNASQLRYPYKDTAYWLVARNGKIIYETGLPPDVGLIKNWQKHFMLGAHVGNRNPNVFESKSLTLIQQPISYDEFIRQQFKLRGLQVGFHNLAYSYAQRNSFSLLVVFKSNPQAWLAPKVEHAIISYPSINFDSKTISLGVIATVLLFLLQKTALGFWIKRKFARQYALFYFSLLALLAAFLVIQVTSIIKAKRFKVNQNLKTQFQQNLSTIESNYLVFRENLEKKLSSELSSSKKNKNHRFLRELNAEICEVNKKEFSSRTYKDDLNLAPLMCRLYAAHVYKQNHKPNELVKRSLGELNKEIIWVDDNQSDTKITMALLSTESIQNRYFKALSKKIPSNWFISKSNQLEWPDDLYLNVRLPTNIFEFDVVYSISKKNAYSDIHQFEFNIYLIIVFVFLLAIPSWYFMSLSMTEPIKKILKGLSNVKQRKWDSLEITSKNEFGNVMQDFNYMVERLREKSELSSFVAEEILEILSNEDGELTSQIEDNAAVIFSDIRSFTSISESHDPVEVVDMLNEYFEIWQSAVQKRGGVIERFIGDAVVVIFFERFSKQYAQDAVQCAMDVMSKMPSFNEERFQKKQFTVKNGVGISQGKVRFSVIGNDVKKHLFASGRPVIDSEILESLSKEGKTSMIMVDEDVYRNTLFEFDYQKIQTEQFSKNIYELELD